MSVGRERQLPIHSRSKNYRIPDHARNNRPERLKEVLAPYSERGLFPAFPSGTDFTEEEVVLQQALQVLNQTVQWKNLHVPRLAEIRKTIAVPNDAYPYLKRMALGHRRLSRKGCCRGRWSMPSPLWAQSDLRRWSKKSIFVHDNQSERTEKR